MAATIRVTSKNLGFMIALSTTYDVRYHRIYPKRWWWIKKRYEIRIPVNDVLGSYSDYWLRARIAHLAAKKKCFKFVMEVSDGKDYLRV